MTAIGPTSEQAELTLVGRFDPPNRDDPFWFGDQTPFPPPDSTELSPGSWTAPATSRWRRRSG